MKLVFRINEGHKISRSSWGLRHWRFEFNYRYHGIRICFSILALWNLWRKSMRRRQKALICYFLFFGGAWIVGGWEVVGWSKCLISNQLKSHLFPAEILAEAINMTHSDMLYRLDIFSFYMLLVWIRLVFMDHCCFRFLSLGNILKPRYSLVYYLFYSQQPRR